MNSNCGLRSCETPALLGGEFHVYKSALPKLEGFRQKSQNMIPAVKYPTVVIPAEVKGSRFIKSSYDFIARYASI